jgi:general secretion pathway protein L
MIPYRTKSLSRITGNLGPAWTFIQKGARSLGNIFLLSPADQRISYKRTLCLTIEKGEISAALGWRFLSRVKIKGLKRYPQSENEYPSPDFLASSLDLARAELGAEGCPVTLCLPKAWAIIKTVDYPLSVLENLSSVISYELDRITPFTPENAYYDFKVFKMGEEKVTILVAAAKADVLEPYLKALRDREVRVDQITVSLLGLSSLSRYMDEREDFLLLTVGESRYEGVLFLSGTRFETISGSFPGGDERARIEQLEKEIDEPVSISDGRDRSVGVIINLKDKSPLLRAGLTSQIKRPLQFLDESDIGFKTAGWGQSQIPYAAVGGALESLWLKSLGLNLLRKGQRKKSSPPWIVSLLLVLTLSGLLGAYWLRPIEIEEQRLQYLEKEITLKKAAVKKVDDLKGEIDSAAQEINLINDFKRKRPVSLNVLKELTLVLPKTAWLTRVRVFESQISIEGYAPSATSLIPRLEATAFFRKVEFAAPTFKDPRLQMDRFQIKMEVQEAEKK